MRLDACPLSGARHARLDCCLVPFPGFPFGASISVGRTFMLLPDGSCRGFPSSSPHLFLYATACRLRRISTPSPFRVLLCCLRRLVSPSASAIVCYRSCTSSSGCASPLRPAGFSVYASPALFALLRSATDARLDTGGWLILTRRGLTPRKMRRASLGAILNTPN
jgi:hypothetical protein